MSDRTIAVFGASGAQGGGVVSALQGRGLFNVRGLTRKPDAASQLGDETRVADLDQPDKLGEALDGAYGVFLNTNSFAAPDTDEIAQAGAVIAAARVAGVQHFVWSTLPDVAEISRGAFNVPHFTNKAAVNDLVSAAGFEFHSFTEPPFYYQNLISPMYPKAPGPDGTPTWRVPMRADARGIHMGDITEYGSLVAGVFESPEFAGDGSILSFAGDLLSWNEIVGVLRGQGHDISFEQTDQDPYGLRDMFAYFEEHTYFGPEADKKTTRAREMTVEPFTDFATWAQRNMTP